MFAILGSIIGLFFTQILWNAAQWTEAVSMVILLTLLAFLSAGFCLGYFLFETRSPKWKWYWRHVQLAMLGSYFFVKGFI